MMTEIYAGERATVHAPADSSTDTMIRFGDGVGYTAYRIQMPVERAAALAARWNACPDAFEKIADAVEDEDWIAVRDAALILRRAIYGDESREYSGGVMGALKREARSGNAVVRSVLAANDYGDESR